MYVTIIISGQRGKKLLCSPGLTNPELWSWKMHLFDLKIYDITA